MSKKQFGYIGAAPTQSFANLPAKYNPTRSSSVCHYVVIAGGGSGGADGGGGGAGGYRSSFGSEASGGGGFQAGTQFTLFKEI